METCYTSLENASIIDVTALVKVNAPKIVCKYKEYRKLGLRNKVKSIAFAVRRIDILNAF